MIRERRTERKEVEKQREKQSSPGEKKKDIELCRLENSYGKLTFGTTEKEIWMDASRKRSFQEPELSTTRKKFEPEHSYREQRGGRTHFVDSLNKSSSAFHVSYYMEDMTVKRLTMSLLQLSERWEQKTLKEMLRGGKDDEIYKKVYRNLMLVEEQRQELKRKSHKAESISAVGMNIEKWAASQNESMSMEESDELQEEPESMQESPQDEEDTVKVHSPRE